MTQVYLIFLAVIKMRSSLLDLQVIPLTNLASDVLKLLEDDADIHEPICIANCIEQVSYSS